MTCACARMRAMASPVQAHHSSACAQWQPPYMRTAQRNLLRNAWLLDTSVFLNFLFNTQRLFFSSMLFVTSSPNLYNIGNGYTIYITLSTDFRTTQLRFLTAANAAVTLSCTSVRRNAVLCTGKASL